MEKEKFFMISIIKSKLIFLHNDYNTYLTFYLSIIILFALIIQIVYRRNKLIIDIFYYGKIFYKNERMLDVNKVQKEIKNCRKLKISFTKRKDFENRKKPKISLIITIYNQEYFIKYIYSSIQRQKLKDIEIIFIDDASSDNSPMIIKNLMKKDKRIIYIHNKINKNAFYSRNRGVLFAKGEYVLIVDPDDLLLNNILIKCYEISKYYNLDILQYFVIRGSYVKNNIWYRNKYKSGILYSEKVKDVFYYSISRTLWDKLIKREVFINGINYMKKEFQNEIYFVHSDDTIFWGIINSAESYGFLEQIGYFYNKDNPVSVIHHYYDPVFINIIFHSLFATLKYYYLQSEDNQIEKNFVGYKFFDEKIYKSYKNRTDNLTEGFNYIIDVLNIYINCSFFNENQKNNLIDFKDIIINRKKQILK